MQLTAARRALVGVALAVLVAPAAAQEAAMSEVGDGAVSVKASAYTDDDDTIVSTQLVDGQVTLPGVTLGGHFLVDGITSASVDVVSAATEGFNEFRYETAVRARVAAPRHTEVDLGVVRSTENDWTSHAAQLTVGRDLAEKNTRLQLGWGYTHNVIGRADDRTFERTLVVNTGELGVTQLVDRRTLVAATYTLARADGYQASPYRYVRLADGTTALPETHPALRTRHAVTVRALRWIGGAALDASYRLYLDDWGIASHTVQAALTITPGERWAVRVRGRFYRQGAAAFWREAYAMPTRYLSVDRELSTFWDAGGGLKVTLHAGRWVVDAKSDVVYYRFADFARLAGRVAVITDLGVGYTW